ncbi:hypothetical protein CY34DRAFT_808719 [Suillus luteus UH-Slu-Lm8-n1]|uniref:Unplaced genomic scaffold CY34scaffold_230, whole genome shotgun sequence n=1 Tax=Suillus luteus UH-Slu-Lm8-n1 TaxID=930992 RepID=A0A0D0B5E3_9AGAM|nr:hypothetical protein CY34DRAFT_808719 [Suillus luteus UH-Slu-Lm8-n1]
MTVRQKCTEDWVNENDPFEITNRVRRGRLMDLIITRTMKTSYCWNEIYFMLALSRSSLSY